MKPIEKLDFGKFWGEEKRGLLYLGFKEEFLENISICWNIVVLPKKQERIKAGDTLFSLETSSKLISIKSPVDAEKFSFLDTAFDRPHSITSTDPLIILYPVKEEKNDEMPLL